jgi:hypothetical protein
MMIAEALQMAESRPELTNYLYVGMGGISFHDFKIMHRHLGIQKMVSVETQDAIFQRQEVNKPFRCIRTEPEDASSVLGRLELDSERAIIWLDYDDIPNDAELDTMYDCVYQARASSFLITTFKADFHGTHEERLSNLLGKVDRARLPSWAVAQKGFTVKECFEVSCDLMSQTVAHAMRERNRASGDGAQHAAVQFLYFKYKDGSPMITIGWRILQREDEEQFRNGPVFDLDFTRAEGEEPFAIEPPVITPAEARLLNAELPCGEDDIPELPGLKPSEVRKYRSVYRYYPVYHEIAHD